MTAVLESVAREDPSRGQAVSKQTAIRSGLIATPAPIQRLD